MMRDRQSRQIYLKNFLLRFPGRKLRNPLDSSDETPKPEQFYIMTGYFRSICSRKLACLPRFPRMRPAVGLSPIDGKKYESNVANEVPSFSSEPRAFLIFPFYLLLSSFFLFFFFIGNVRMLYESLVMELFVAT